MKWEPHITVAAIIERKDTFLLVEELVEGTAVFNQPAGHWEPGETLREAAQRETLEETGWEFYPTALVGIYQWQHPRKNETFLRFSFCGNCSKQQISTELDDGILNANWHHKDTILALPETKIRSTLVTESIKDYLAGKRNDLNMMRDIHQHW
ncbi:MAG: NUDIX hydrolase [Gammaproteobacteria bacterium]